MNEEFKEAYIQLKNNAKYAQKKIDSVLLLKDTYRNLPHEKGIEEMKTMSRYLHIFCEGIDKYIGEL